MISSTDTRQPPSPLAAPATLQINLTPGDYRFAVKTIPHQLRQLAGQFGEVLLTVDTNGRNLQRRRDDQEAFGRLMDWIESLRPDYPQLRAVEADYRPETVQNISRLYFERGDVPAKASRGAFYAYFEGLHQARFDHVLHLDADMLIGGGSPTWVGEAIDFLEANPAVLSVSPFPGPPAPGLELKTQQGEPLPVPRGAYRFQYFSSRVFFLDRRRLEQSDRKIRLRRATPRLQVRAFIERTSPMAIPEDLVTDFMRDHGLSRVDFLGQEPGLWAMHPPYRTEAFYDKLPAIIQAVESGNLPAGQLGDYDINDSLVDWSDAREALRRNRWWRRYFPKLGLFKAPR